MTSLSLWVRSMQILLVAYPIANLSSFLKNSVFTNKLVIGSGEGIVREFRINMYTLLYVKWTTNSDPLYSTGRPAPCYIAA